MKASPPYPAKRIVQTTWEQTGLGDTFVLVLLQLYFGFTNQFLRRIQRAGIALGRPKCFGIWFSEIPSLSPCDPAVVEINRFHSKVFGTCISACFIRTGISQLS